MVGYLALRAGAGWRPVVMAVAARSRCFFGVFRVLWCMVWIGGGGRYAEERSWEWLFFWVGVCSVAVMLRGGVR